MSRPAAPAWLDAASLYADLALPAGPAGRPYVAVNMVATADGKAVVGGRAASLGSPLDRLLLRRVRAAADAVLVGAGTLRAEGYDARVGPEQQAARLARGEPPQPLAAVLTASGDLPLGRSFFRVPAQRAVVLTSGRALRAHPERFDRLRQVAQVLVVGDGGGNAGDHAPAAAEAVAALGRELGVRRLVVEGGPSLNQALFAAAAVDELFLTLAPRVVGGRSRSIVEGAGDHVAPLRELARLELLSAAAADGELFLRYRVAR